MDCGGSEGLAFWIGPHGAGGPFVCLVSIIPLLHSSLLSSRLLILLLSYTLTHIPLHYISSFIQLFVILFYVHIQHYVRIRFYVLLFDSTVV